MACMWRKNGGCGSSGKKLPPDVPRGHLAVTVGEAKKRFVIRADYLNHPLLQQLLDQEAYEGNGFNKSGPLAIPCDEFLFEDILHSLRRSSSSSHVPTKKLDLSLSKDSVSLLQGFDCKRISNNYKH
ncbi:auxin-induced protein 15A-like [Lotus japonicus]|uniref:auxin-induced protein 15A-like n=1 Tax=Lotus japonicus TaxID=34305 RepID=UPI00258F8FDD|nr:auxin-induced protein 15A-like [Lotus japonicus]